MPDYKLAIIIRFKIKIPDSGKHVAYLNKEFT